MGDLGGILQFIVVVFAMVVAPVSKYSFILEYASNLFYGRVKSKYVFSSLTDRKSQMFLDGDLLNQRE